MPVPLVPIAIGVGRATLPTLAKEFAKRGGTAFIKKYGRQTFNALVGGTAGYEASKFIPTIHGGEELPKIEQESFPAEDKIKSWDESFKAPEKIETNKGFEVPSQEKVVPPGFETPDIVDTSILTKDITKQTKDLVTKEPEFGALTEAEKQTAIALKGDKPDYYSRIIKAISDSKQSKMPAEQWKNVIGTQGTKDEMDFLGLTEKLQGDKSITKEDLLTEVSAKDIASKIYVTSIPKEEWVSEFGEYSLGFENEGTQEQIVFQIDTIPETAADMEFGLSGMKYQTPSSHFKEQFGRNTFAHVRLQVGYGDPDSPPADIEVEQASEISDKLKNTLIIDEIQSDWIQDIRKYGTEKDWTVIKGSDIDEKFIEENFGERYYLKTSKYATLKQTLEKTGLQHNKVLYIKDKNISFDELNDAEAASPVLTNIDNDKYYVFDKSRLKGISGWDTEKAAKSQVDSEATANLPIKQSKKYVELILREMIKKATNDGRDSIAITNGNIQLNRSKRQGNKKFYDNIVLTQLEKIAKSYGVKVETINIEPDKYLKLQENLKKIEAKGFEETTIGIDELRSYIKANTTYGPSRGIVDLPDFREIILPGGERFVGEEFDSVIKNKTYDRGTNESMDKIYDKDYYYVFKNKETGEINFEYPVVNKRFMLQTDKTLKRFLEGSQQQAESMGGALIKMKLPKKLQKDILKEPIRISKINEQTQRLVT